MWRSLSLTMLQAEYRTERACELPEYLGSTVRGAFGEELRARSCREPEAPCAVVPSARSVCLPAPCSMVLAMARPAGSG